MSHDASLFMVLVPALALGCADEVVALDGGADASIGGGDDAGFVVAPPDIPWLGEGVPPIQLAPCPDGWREVHGGAVTECDPYPEGGAESCDAGEAHFPGEAGCRPIGDTCPSGDYAPDLSTRGCVVYVNRAAAEGGDGTLPAPYAALSEVPWRSLASSTTVALAKGTYPGILPVRAGVSVIGACVRDTVVTGITAGVPSVVSVSTVGEAAAVENLTIRGAPQRGVLVQRGESLELRGVLIDGVLASGIHAQEAGADVTLTDVVVRNTQSDPAINFGAGMGILMNTGVNLVATRLVVVGNQGLGVYVAGEGAFATLTDTAILDTQPRPTDNTAGRGTRAESGARVEATRILISGSYSAGVVSRDPGAMVTLTDAVVADTHPQASDGSSGRGVSVLGAAGFSGTRLLVAGNANTGVLVDDPDTGVVLTDAVIRNTTPSTIGPPGGRGLRVQRGSHLDATRVLVTDNVGGGVVVGGEGTRTSFTDVALRDTASTGEPREDTRALWVQLAATFDASRLLIVNSPELGLGAGDEGTLVELTDTVIRDTRSQPIDQRYGRAVLAQFGARIVASRLVVERSVGLGIAAFVGGFINAEDATIHDIALSDCASTSCPRESFGYGVGAISGSVTLTRFQVGGAAICGVMVARAAGFSDVVSLDLMNGGITGSPIGACVQVDGYDIDRLSVDVRYEDNAMNLDSTTLPVPGPVSPLGM